jgi:ApaG protein
VFGLFTVIDTDSQAAMNEQNEHLIQIVVETAYLADQSSPESGRYAFAYTITIRNEGGKPARLLNRHWVITDANGKVQEVRGEGVVGEQPYLRPGEGFQYTSGTLLDTPVGSMEGEYGMVDDNGAHFLAAIPAFSLSVPRSLH